MNFVAFLEGTGTDDKGRRIAALFEYSDLRLELSHDYIQRLFPLQEASKHSKAPLITDDEIDVIRCSPDARRNLHLAYERMLAFWKLDGDRYHTWGKDAPKRHWNRENNHNYLRMTRVLKSLKLLGMDEEYRDFSVRLSYLLQLRKDTGAIRFSDETAQIWEGLLLDLPENH